MSKRLIDVAGVAAALVLWVAHLYLPVLERTEPKPGWVQIYLVFWPMGWPLLCSHLLFLIALGMCLFRRWREVVSLMIVAILLLGLCRPGPISYAGTQALWAAYSLLLLLGTFRLIIPNGSDQQSECGL